MDDSIPLEVSDWLSAYMQCFIQSKLKLKVLQLLQEAPFLSGPTLGSYCYLGSSGYGPSLPDSYGSSLPDSRPGSGTDFPHPIANSVDKSAAPPSRSISEPFPDNYQAQNGHNVARQSSFELPATDKPKDKELLDLLHFYLRSSFLYPLSKERMPRQIRQEGSDNRRKGGTTKRPNLDIVQDSTPQTRQAWFFTVLVSCTKDVKMFE